MTREKAAAYARAVLEKKNINQQGRIAWLARTKIFFAWAAGRGLILADPVVSVRLPRHNEKKHPRFLSQGQAAKLLDGIKDARDRALFELLYSTGIRSGELRNLTVGNIDWQQHTLTILLGKNRKDRVVPIGKVALHWIERYLHQSGRFRPNVLIFPSADGKPLREEMLCAILARNAKAAGIKKRCTPYIFRHSFAIHMLEGGAGIAHIAAMLGHAHLSTTQHYTQVAPTELIAAHRKSHPAGRGRGKFLF